jgi:ADP-heptose:LPS heptosyltransferase
VVIHPGADAEARRWPAVRFAEVAARLRADGHRVVLTGGPGEERLVRDVVRRAGLPGTDVFAGVLSFDRLSALTAHASLLVSGDTGPAHLAVAHATPSVALYGPVSPHRWGPPPRPQHVALWHPGPAGDPHGTAVDPCLLRITADEVVDAARGALTTGALAGGPDTKGEVRGSSPRI